MASKGVVLSQGTAVKLREIINSNPGEANGNVQGGGGQRQVIHVNVTEKDEGVYFKCTARALNGTTGSWVDYDGECIAREPDGKDLKLGTTYLAERYGLKGDKYVFVTQAVTGADDHDAPECSGCGWLAEEIDHTKTALLLSIPSGLGRCDCIDPNQAGNEEDGTAFHLYYDDGVWRGMKNFKTCCGCGTVAFVQDEGDLTGTLTLQINRACDGGGNYSFEMKHECCQDGQATFVGWGPKNCSGDKTGCVDIFRVQITCETIPECLTCECERCGHCCLGGQAPSLWRVDSGGWTGDCDVLNGTWWMEHVEGCEWRIPKHDAEADSDEAGAGCGFVIDLHLLPGEQADEDKFEVTFSSDGGGASYQILAEDFVCCSSNTLSRVGGATCGAPDHVTITPAPCASTCDPDKICHILPPVMVATITNKTGDCDCLPDSFELTKVGGDDSAQYQSDYVINDCQEVPFVEDYVQLLCAAIQFGHEPGHYLAATCGTGSYTRTAYSCDPLYAAFDASPGMGPQPTTCCPTGGGTFTIVFTEPV